MLTPTQEKMYAFWRKWFAQPLDEKMKHLRQSGKGGYYPPGSEAPGYEAKADPKEYFHVRLTHCFGPDAIFPPEVYSVFRECENKADEWLQEHGFDESIADHCPSSNHVLRVLRYPPTQDGNVGQAHCDFDLLTVSVPGTAPGLEVAAPGYDDPGSMCWGLWEPSEAFEVHVGEMLSIYTNHLVGSGGARGSRFALEATPHRVRTPPNTERLKAVFFYLPPTDFELKPGFTAGDYLKGVLTKAGTINVGA